MSAFTDYREAGLFEEIQCPKCQFKCFRGQLLADCFDFRNGKVTCDCCGKKFFPVIYKLKGGLEV